MDDARLAAKLCTRPRAHRWRPRARLPTGGRGMKTGGVMHRSRWKCWYGPGWGGRPLCRRTRSAAWPWAKETSSHGFAAAVPGHRARRYASRRTAATDTSDGAATQRGGDEAGASRAATETSTKWRGTRGYTYAGSPIGCGEGEPPHESDFIP